MKSILLVAVVETGMNYVSQIGNLQRNLKVLQSFYAPGLSE